MLLGQLVRIFWAKLIDLSLQNFKIVVLEMLIDHLKKGDYFEGCSFSVNLYLSNFTTKGFLAIGFD